MDNSSQSHEFGCLNIEYKFSSSSGHGGEDQYINEYGLEIFGICDNERIFIGKASVELYLVGLAQTHNFDLNYVFDTSDTRRNFFDRIYSFERHRFRKGVEEMVEENLGPNLLVIDRIEILPEFREYGYGKKVIKDIILRLNGSFGVAVITAYPLQLEAGVGRDEWGEKMKYSDMEHDLAKATKSLYGFYKSMGFERKRDYFFYNPTYRNSFFDNIEDKD